MIDFTMEKYLSLLHTLYYQNYSFQTFAGFLSEPQPKSIILRHDVDLRPEHSLQFARLQHSMGISGVYYFRAVPESWDEGIIREIADLGHEIGYHYECLTTCRGNVGLAIRDFEDNLSRLRALVPVSTICMHGSPMSKYDSKDLWKGCSYREYGIVGEPYFDVDFSRVAYLTDTGRRWDGENVSVRDKVTSAFTHPFKRTNDIIAAAGKGLLPSQVMFTFHPQRWSSNLPHWGRELLLQRTKNLIKKYFFV